MGNSSDKPQLPQRTRARPSLRINSTLTASFPHFGQRKTRGNRFFGIRTTFLRRLPKPNHLHNFNRNLYSQIHSSVIHFHLNIYAPTLSNISGQNLNIPISQALKPLHRTFLVHPETLSSSRSSSTSQLEALEDKTIDCGPPSIILKSRRGSTRLNLSQRSYL